MHKEKLYLMHYFSYEFILFQGFLDILLETQNIYKIYLVGMGNHKLLVFLP